MSTITTQHDELQAEIARLRERLEKANEQIRQQAFDNLTLTAKNETLHAECLYQTQRHEFWRQHHIQNLRKQHAEAQALNGEPIDWKMPWYEHVRGWLGLPASAKEIARRRAYIEAGGNWPPLPRAFSPVPPPPPAALASDDYEPLGGSHE